MHPIEEILNSYFEILKAPENLQNGQFVRKTLLLEISERIRSLIAYSLLLSGSHEDLIAISYLRSKFDLLPSQFLDAEKRAKFQLIKDVFNECGLTL